MWGKTTLNKGKTTTISREKKLKEKKFYLLTREVKVLVQHVCQLSVKSNHPAILLILVLVLVLPVLVQGVLIVQLRMAVMIKGNDSDDSDDIHSGCRNVGQCHQQQSFLRTTLTRMIQPHKPGIVFVKIQFFSWLKSVTDL